MIIYPMNALVEDQMSRIRRILDSDYAKWFRNNLNNNRIYFGRYTGDSIPTGTEFKENGNRDTKKVDQLRDHFINVEKAQAEISTLSQQSKRIRVTCLKIVMGQK